MVRAITGIDEDLISDAHNVSRVRVIRWRKLGTLAAGLVLIVSAAFLFRPGGENIGTTIRVSGQTLTEQSVTIEQADSASAIRAYSLEPVAVFTVPMEIEIRGRTRITVSGGNMQAFDSEGSRLLYEGEAFETEENVRIFWNVETDGSAVRFEMSVEGGKTADTVILTCDDGVEWRICKVRS